jgi:glutamyl-Q tRNA(Asp) synthetase
VIPTGRFAPSPTGPLHVGSLAAAVGSYLFARASGGRWLVRIDDLDPPRTVPGAADAQLRALEAYGLHWDGDVTYQSRRTAAYEESLARLATSGCTFPCGCSRADLAGTGGGSVYPGACRNGLPLGRTGRSIRVRVAREPVSFVDRLLGGQRHDLAAICGDFVVRRADGLFAYQLAVVVDDLASGVTEVVRGADLLASTGRQIHLYRCLGATPPDYAHLPLVVTRGGEKLSKGCGAQPIPTASPAREATLRRILGALGQAPDGLGAAAPVAEQLAAALVGFDAARVPRWAVCLDGRVPSSHRTSKVGEGEPL